MAGTNFDINDRIAMEDWGVGQQSMNACDKTHLLWEETETVGKDEDSARLCRENSHDLILQKFIAGFNNVICT